MRALVVLCLICFATVTANAQFKEETHYVVVADEKTKEPTVTEYFSLFCGHCFQFEPLLADFQKQLPEGTDFEKSHVTYLPKGNDLVGEGIVRAFVIMEKLGKTKELSKVFFTKIHIDQFDINTLDKIKGIFVENGVSAAQYDKLFNDNAIIEEAGKMSKDWLDKRIVSVPTMVVNGKYRVNMGSLKDMNELNALVKYLLEQ